MTNKRFINSLRHIAIFLAVIGMAGAASTVSAQRGQAPKQPVVVFAPSLQSNTDFTGDFQNDIVFFNIESAKWVTYRSDGETSAIGFSKPGALPVAADYDGDNIVDIAAVQNVEGLLTWQILQSSDGAVKEVGFGVDGDVPVKGDYDGDGTTDIAVWRASEGNWYIFASSTGETLTITHGLSTDRAVPGDYDGDGKTDAAVFRQDELTFYYLGSLDDVVHAQPWGGPFKKGDTLVSADYDGDATTDFAIFNAASGVWTIRESSLSLYRAENLPVTPSICSPFDINPCPEDDIAFPSDYDNDGKADPAVWNDKSGQINIIGSLMGAMQNSTEMLEGQTPVSAYFITK